MISGKLRFWLGLACLALAATPAQAQRSTDPFSALVGRRERALPREVTQPVDRYLIATDDRVFLFQAGAKEGRLKFLCGDRDLRMDCRIDRAVPAEEIYVVAPTRAPRGDVVWRDPSGSVRLRIAAYGGATVRWPGDAGEHAAARSYGEDPSLRLDAADLETADRRARRATALVSALIGSPILFEIEDAPTGDASVLADAIARAAKAIGHVGDDATGARVLSQRIREVVFRPGDAPALSIAGDQFVVVYAPGLELAGRASSAEIERFLESSL